MIYSIITKSCKAHLLAALCLLLFPFAAIAQVPFTFTTDQGAEYGRIIASAEENSNTGQVLASAEISNGVLVIRFNQPFTGDPSELVSGLSSRIALARAGADGQTLRIALRGNYEVQSSRSYNVFAFDLVAKGSLAKTPAITSPRSRREALASTAARKRADEELARAKRLARDTPALPLSVRFAENPDFTRIIFDWTQRISYRRLDRSDGVDVIFDKAAAPALAELQSTQPRGLTGIRSVVRKNKTIVSLDVSNGFETRIQRDGSHVLIDLYRQAEQEPIANVEEKPAIIPASHKPEGPRTNPVPANGSVAVKVAATGSSLQLAFDWDAPIGAAVFRRGEAVWMVFDANAALDMSELVNIGNRHVIARNILRGQDYVGLRIQTPPSTQVEARPNADGSSWTFILADKLEFPIEAVQLRREADGSGPGRIAANLKNASSLLWVDDAEIGDRMAVVTGYGSAQGIPSKRRFVQVNALASAQGMAFEINADNLQTSLHDDLLTIYSTRGLTLTPSARPLDLAGSKHALSTGPTVPAITASPGFTDFEGWKKLADGATFEEAFSALLRRVAAEDTDPEARMILARFLISHELGAEALGALSLAQALDPMLVQDARFRALRGVANLQMHRIKDAKADFSAQTLNQDPSGALWRGYLASKTEDWTEARQNFEKGREAFYLFTPEWQAKFHTAFALAAINLNDMGTAKGQLQEVFGNNLSLETQLEASLVRALYQERTGAPKEAIGILKNVKNTEVEPLTVRAIFQDTQLRMNSGELSPLEASDILENLRFRWRGDELELEVVRTLGAFYTEAGDYRRAMEAMSLAIRRFPDSPVARRLEDDLRATYLELFLEGGADTMDPVQAVALFYEFNDFVPITSDGDRMLRRLVDRLIAFDLLPQAAELLQYQVDKKLFGLGKAQIATDLALVYLMDRRPEKALAAIRGSRQARLPRDLNQERRLLEARALVELGRTEHAKDLIEMDRTREADFLRADIVWASKQWPAIARQLQSTITRHFNNPEKLADEEASMILRASLASALADDTKGFAELTGKWAELMAETPAAEAYQLISSNSSLSGVEVKDLARTIGATGTMRSYIDQYRSRVAANSASAS